MHTIPGIPDKTIQQGLHGEYVCLDEFLQNYTVNNPEVQDIQSYVDSSGNVAYRNKRQKRRINSFNTCLEAWHNYERLLLSFHSFHLYDACSKYKLLMLSLDRKYTWSSLAILDMKHRLSLSGHSVQFDTIDSVLFSSIMDPTTVKTAATRCYHCKSFDNTMDPFPRQRRRLTIKQLGAIVPQHKGIKPVLSPSPKSVITSITSAVSSRLAKDSMLVDHVGGTSHMSSESSKDIVQ